MLKRSWVKAPIFVLCLGPVAWLGWRAWNDKLGANPIEFITHATGLWTLRFLAITLAVTPIRKLAGLPDLIRFRRMFGLFAFFYGTLHFLTYVWLDKFFDVHAMLKDIARRRFIMAGFTAFVLLIPLAMTSTAGWIRRLGGKGWRKLHRLVYVCALAGVVHYFWLVKSDIRPPERYAAIVGVLLAYRVGAWWLARRRRVPAGGRAKVTATPPPPGRDVLGGEAGG